MLLKKTLLVIAGSLMIFAFPLWAGDSASFIDLGFSPDGKIFMFAQYGVQSKTLKPWADLFVVDVAQNNFVSGGKISYTHDGPVIAGQDGSGAFYRLIAKNTNLADQYRVDYLNQGQPLFIAPGLEASANGESIDFRDFESDIQYRATLVPYVEGAGTNLKSSFYINLESTSRGGARKSYTVGSPQVKRAQVASYGIKKVIIAPHDGSMVFVIEMKKQADTGPDIRYMVEALRL